MITGNEAGFDEFVAARSAALSRTAYLLTGDHHLAQDLVQAALLQAVKHWRRIHTSPEAYVRRHYVRRCETASAAPDCACAFEALRAVASLAAIHTASVPAAKAQAAIRAAHCERRDAGEKK